MCSALIPTASLFSLAEPITLPQPRWAYVTRRFEQFITNLCLTQAQLDDGFTKISGIVKCLNKHYWGASTENNYVLAGSWGKHTRVRPPSDIDIIFILPFEVYSRFLLRFGNVQSQLLQEVKEVLGRTYSQTNMRGDGQVVVVPFNSLKIEVVPAFRLTDGKAWICNTKNGGNYKTIDPATEIKSFHDANKYNNEARELTMMLKCWKDTQNVPVKSFMLERLAIEFLQQWHSSGNGVFWYDFMVRDFFKYMQTRVDTHIIMPGTFECVWLGDEWKAKAEKAYKAAVTACDYEQTSSDTLAKLYWQDIFGSYIQGVI